MRAGRQKKNKNLGFEPLELGDRQKQQQTERAKCFWRKECLWEYRWRWRLL